MVIPSLLRVETPASDQVLFCVAFGFQLMENAVFTFQQLLSPHLQGEAAKTAVAIEKVKLRVLKVKPASHLWEA